MNKSHLIISMVIVLVLMAIAFAPKHLTSVSGTQQQSSSMRDQNREKIEQKKASFKSGRDLLLKHGVPFDPDLLMEPGFQKRLKPVFAKMPEFRETHVVGKQMKGVQLADTLFLPENVELTGDTVIIANNMIFSGKNAVIKGPHDLHFFALGPVLSLNMNARHARGQSSTFVKVAFSKPRLVKAVFSGASIEEAKRAGQLVEPDRITLNVDGRGRDEWLESQKAAKARFANHARRSTTQQQENIDKDPGATETKEQTVPFQLSLKQTVRALRVFVQVFQMAVRETPDTPRLLRELAELAFAVLMATMGAPSTLPLPTLATLTSITSQPKADGAARVDQAVMVDFLPVVERVGEVDRVILVPARYRRERVVGAAQVEKAAGEALAVWVGPVLMAAKAAQ